MRLSEEALPKWIAGGVTLLLAPVLWLVLDGGPPPAEPESAAALAEESFGAQRAARGLERDLVPAEDLAFLVARIESAGPESFQNLIVPAELNSYSSQGLASILAALERRLATDPGSVLLEVEAQVILAAIQTLAKIDDPGKSLSILRERAITAGGVERFAKIGEKLLKHPRLARWLAEHDQTDPGWILETAALLEDRGIAAQWTPILLWETGDSAPSLNTSAEWARALAYLAGRTRDRNLRSELIRYLDLPSLENRKGGTRSTARRIALWLNGVDQLAAVEADLERNPTSSEIEALTDTIESSILGIEAALAEGDRRDRDDFGLTNRLARRALLDLTRARIAAARLREEQTSLRPTGSLESRARKLLHVGMASLELEDRQELSQVIEILERSRADFYTRLLRAGRVRLDGGERGEASILDLLALDEKRPKAERLLYPRDVERWRRFAARGDFATIVDVPALRFESGKTWAELGGEGRDGLDRTLEILRTELQQRRDLAYLTFLEARVALGEGRTEGYEARLLQLLDEGPPPGLSRSEIGGLLVLFEERASQLAGAEGLRAEALAALPLLERDAGRDPFPVLAGQLLRFRIEHDTGSASVLGRPDVKEKLDAFEELLTGGRGLTFDLGLERLRLRDELFARGEQLARQGDLSLAREIFDRVRRLAGDGIDLWIAEAELERALAESLDESEPERAKEHWLAAAHAFDRTARRDPKRSNLWIDAARAAIAGGDLDLADEATNLASDSFSHGRGDDSQRWNAIVLDVQIERILGNAEQVIRETRRAIEEHGVSSPHWEALCIDQAWAYEKLGDDALAIQTLEVLRKELLTTSLFWKEAVYQRARIIEKSLTGSQDETGVRALSRARDAWGEAASWLEPRSGSADFAVACLHAAEHSLELGETEKARRYLDDLFSAEDAFLAADPRQVERARWEEISERGMYTLGEVHRATSRPKLAREAFETAIERFPRSTRVPLGYLMLGILAEERGDPDEALGLYRRGLRKAEAIGPDLTRDPYFDVRDRLTKQIDRIEAGKAR